VPVMMMNLQLFTMTVRYAVSADQCLPPRCQFTTVQDDSNVSLQSHKRHYHPKCFAFTATNNMVHPGIPLHMYLGDGVVQLCCLLAALCGGCVLNCETRIVCKQGPARPLIYAVAFTAGVEYGSDIGRQGTALCSKMFGAKGKEVNMTRRRVGKWRYILTFLDRDTNGGYLSTSSSGRFTPRERAPLYPMDRALEGGGGTEAEWTLRRCLGRPDIDPRPRSNLSP
jgi:hypothetical protein